MLTRRHLLAVFAAVAVCALLYVAHVRSQRLLPAHAPITATATGSFVEGEGWHPGEPFAHAAPNLRAWGSWSGNDANTGTLTLGPFPAPRVLHFGVGGYPTNPGNSLHVERSDTRERLEIKYHPVGERWFVCDFELPPAWVGHPIRILAVDNSTILGGWLALTEPLRGGHSDGNNALLETTTSFALNALLLALLHLAAARLLTQNPKLKTQNQLLPHWLPLLAGATVATAGYLVYWSYFATPWLGQTVTGALFLAATVLLLRSKPQLQTPNSKLQTNSAPAELPRVLALTATIGLFHVAILHLFPTGHDFYTLTANRFRDGMPGDNMLSHMYAERLFAGEAPKSSADEWQSSDRPPLQIGWQLLTWPASKLLNLDRKTFSGTSAIWFQLLWVPALYGFLRAFQLTPRRATAWTAACALSGFFLQNTTFTWPKLSAAAFTVAAYALLFPVSQISNSKSQIPLAAALAALAWLSHGGVAFSFLPLLPVLLWRFLRDLRARQFRPWLVAAAVFAAFVLPWIAYQKFYEPPGNRLLKWHFTDQQARDPRGFLQTFREAYAKIGWRQAWQNKVDNFHGQIFGDYRYLGDISTATKADRRNQEFFHVGRGLTWWPILVPFALVLTRRRFFANAPPLSVTATTPPSPPAILTPDLLALAAWLAATIVVWCLLMFAPYTAAIHQGSYAVMLGLFALCSVLLDRTARGWLLLLAALQVVTLATTWAVSNAAIQGPATGLPFVLLTAAPLAYFILRGVKESILSPTPPSPPQPKTQNPKLKTVTLCALAAAFTFVLFLRKPHAFHTPQLWAEDGSVFVIEADTLGLQSFVTPYAGYLHTLPRIIAWLASVLVDPAWWPAFYNGAAILIWLAAMLRFFSSRLALPAKPLIALALVCVPHQGEVFFNVTNLQWVTAFVLLQQVLIAAPRNRREAVLDAALVALLALTGPFGAALLPLFFIRCILALRTQNSKPKTQNQLQTPTERQRQSVNPKLQTIALCAVVIACTATQAWFLVHTGPRLDYQSAPFQLWSNIVIAVRRLLVWPALGNDLALALPPWVIGTFGGAFLVALFAWCCRPHPLRAARLQVIGAFFLMLAAGIYRTRPDTWPSDNLGFADRYFYIPRVLLLWLLLWECNSTPRWIASVARVTCLLILFVHIRDFTLRAPPNYEWAKHVEPLRRGEPARIPILPEGWNLEYPGRRK